MVRQSKQAAPTLELRNKGNNQPNYIMLENTQSTKGTNDTNNTNQKNR